MSTISAGTTTTTALVQTGDTTGALVLQTGSTPTTALTLSSAQAATFTGPVNFASWTTATRPASPTVGQMGYNTTTGLFDQYTASGWSSVGAAPGNVIQVVQASYATAFSTTSTSYVATGLTASITPKFATSKILAQFSVVCGNGTNQWHYCTLYRNSTTNIVSGNGVPSGYLNNNSSDYLTTLNAQILDAPATTSATTYTLYTKCTGGNTIRCFVDNYPAYITLMEIAA